MREFRNGNLMYDPHLMVAWYILLVLWSYNVCVVSEGGGELSWTAGLEMGVVEVL